MPVVVELLTTDGEHFTGAGPEVVIDVLGRGDGGVDFSDGFAWFVAEAAGEGELAEVAFFDPVEDVVPALFGAALEAVGDGDSVVGLTEGEFFSFPYVVGDGFFDVDVLAHGGGGEGDEGVGVVAGGDGDGVDLGVFTDLAVVGVGFEAGEFVAFFEVFGAAGDLVGVDIAQSDEAGFFVRDDGVDVGGAPAFDADDDDAEFAIGSGGAGVGSEEGEGSGVDGRADEMTAVHLILEVREDGEVDIERFSGKSSVLNDEAVFLCEGFAFFEGVVAEVGLVFFALEIVSAEGVGGEEAVVTGVPPGGVAEVGGVVHEGDDGGFTFGVGAVVGDPFGALAPGVGVLVAFGVFDGSFGDFPFEAEGGGEAEAE